MKSTSVRENNYKILVTVPGAWRGYSNSFTSFWKFSSLKYEQITTFEALLGGNDVVTLAGWLGHLANVSYMLTLAYQGCK